MPASARDLITPICAQPRAEPLPRARPTFPGGTRLFLSKVFFISFHNVSSPLQQIGYLLARFFSLLLQGHPIFINIFFNVSYFPANLFSSFLFGPGVPNLCFIRVSLRLIISRLFLRCEPSFQQGRLGLKGVLSSLFSSFFTFWLVGLLRSKNRGRQETSDHPKR